MINLPKQLFSAWMGPGQMSVARSAALNSILMHCGVPFNFVTHHNMSSWIHPDYPIHPAFNYLSAVHKCDYLRCYLLHVYGGGYTDIKTTNHNWNKFFEFTADADAQIFGAGYTEVGPHGVARVGGLLEIEMKDNYEKLIGICSLIIKPLSEFSREWFGCVQKLLDENYCQLQKYPARHPQDHFGAIFQGGLISKYPLVWTGIGGDIFHPLVYKNSEKFLHIEMAPSFENYR